jgi:hypothetical protein
VVLVLAHRLLRMPGRRALTAAVTFLAGLFFALEFFLPAHLVGGKQKNFLTDFITPATLVISVIGSFTVGLGVYSLTQVHGRNLLRRRPGWYNSLAFFIAMVAMFAFTLCDYYYKRAGPSPALLPWPKATYEILFNGLYMPLQQATFSLLAFYIASAAYRAFRIRSAEAALMMAAAFIVMLGQVPLGTWLTHWMPQTGPLGFLGFFRVERLADWIMVRWNSAAQRGITFGIAVGALAMSLRIWLSLERGAFFSEGSVPPSEPAPVGSATEA